MKTTKAKIAEAKNTAREKVKKNKQKEVNEKLKRTPMENSEEMHELIFSALQQSITNCISTI